MVQDLRAVNEATVLDTPIVPNPHTLLSGIPPTAEYFTVVDLANAFYSVPLHSSCRYLFAFTHEKKQYTWAVMPQGGQNSPSQFAKAITSILDTWQKEHPAVTLLIYVDDLLLCTDDQPTAEENSESLLCYLADQGCKASKAKIQWCSKTVTFLGHCISKGTRHITSDRVAAIKDIPQPQATKQLHAFLGLISYCRAWIPDASILMQPLYDALKSVPFTLSSEALDNFFLLKQAISTAPALGLPDYGIPFKLFVSERKGHATGVLAQPHGGWTRPIGYYSCRLDPVARGGPSCLRAVFAAQALLDKTSDLVLAHPLLLLAPHDIAAILNQVQPRHLSTARHLRLQISLLLPDNVTLQRCLTLNPATLLPFFEGGQDGEDEEGIGEDEEKDPCTVPHDCLEMMRMETTHLPTVSETPLENPDYILFVDGSRYADEGGKYHTGYAVTSEFEILQSGALPPTVSAQEVELHALTTACRIAEGKRANIYTDSRYALGVAHDFGIIWRARGFLTAAGTLVKHGPAIKELMDALLLPDQVAVLKVKAHGKLNSQEARGNHLADIAAKQGAKDQRKMAEVAKEESESLAQMPLAVHVPSDRLYLASMQRAAYTDEHLEWIDKGAEYEGDLYLMRGKTCLPKYMYPAVVQWAHGPAHLSKNLMNSLISKYYWAPGITTLTRNYCTSCAVCAKCNPGRTEKTPQKHLAKPLYAFQRIQIDHIQMPKSGRYEYALVMVDMFSGWPEAYAVTNMTAKTTAKKLLSELVCRFGVPEVIESDQGPAFTATLTKEIWAALGVQLALHTPYHPQSSGKVERMNGTLKNRMLKMAQETNMSWPDSLPIALFSVRHTPRGKHALSPYEILFGSAPRLGCYFPQQLQLQSDVLTSYVTRLSEELTNIHSQVFSSIPDPETDSGTHSLQTGDWVLVKKFVRKHSLEPRYDGPFQVLLTTATSVKLEGKSTWIHASHCKKVPAPEDKTLPTS
ncbi:uncharacterized protein LOC120946223 [Rana temporaria]|uniref:uncharacterized protein LOC120946223 n=1 Tax=Rana temporaria TaxID=8407 RepID=UPI001AADE16C|nr:uncharacterized protein LOC120946223 [Rana temporaria]